MSFFLRTSLAMSAGIAMIPILDKGSKTLPLILTISAPCFTHLDFNMAYQVTEIQLQTLMKSSIFPLNEPKNGPVSHPIVSDHGYRHSEIMHLTEDISMKKRSWVRSRPLKDLVLMVGCSGIQGTIIPLFLGRSEQRKTVELRFVRF